MCQQTILTFQRLAEININFLLMLHACCGLAIALLVSAGLYVCSNSWALSSEQLLSGSRFSHGEEMSRGHK